MLKKKSERINVVVSVDVVTRWSTNDSYEICKLICYKKKPCYSKYLSLYIKHRLHGLKGDIPKQLP